MKFRDFSPPIYRIQFSWSFGWPFLIYSPPLLWLKAHLFHPRKFFWYSSSIVLRGKSRKKKDSSLRYTCDQVLSRIHHDRSLLFHLIRFKAFPTNFLLRLLQRRSSYACTLLHEGVYVVSPEDSVRMFWQGSSFYVDPVAKISHRTHFHCCVSRFHASSFWCIYQEKGDRINFFVS